MGGDAMTAEEAGEAVRRIREGLEGAATEIERLVVSRPADFAAAMALEEAFDNVGRVWDEVEFRLWDETEGRFWLGFVAKGG
jgi:hypothetical protein